MAFFLPLSFYPYIYPSLIRNPPTGPSNTQPSGQAKTSDRKRKLSEPDGSQGFEESECAQRSHKLFQERKREEEGSGKKRWLAILSLNASKP
jgi:hypothetical protein